MRLFEWQESLSKIDVVANFSFSILRRIRFQSCDFGSLSVSNFERSSSTFWIYFNIFSGSAFIKPSFNALRSIYCCLTVFLPMIAPPSWQFYSIGSTVLWNRWEIEGWDSMNLAKESLTCRVNFYDIFLSKVSKFFRSWRILDCWLAPGGDGEDFFDREVLVAREVREFLDILEDRPVIFSSMYAGTATPPLILVFSCTLMAACDFFL